MPSSCGMFVYSDVTSAVTEIAFSGRGGRDVERSCRKCFLFRMYEGEYFHKRLYEVCDIVRKLIGGAVTC